MNGVREFVNRKVRPLTRPVNREEAQADDAQSKKVRVVSAKVLAGEFGGRVGAQRLGQGQVLGKGNRLREPVDRRTRGKQEFLHPVLARGLEEVVGSGDVRVNVKLRVFHRRPDARPRCDVDDRVKFSLREKRLNRRAIPDIPLNHIGRASERRHVGPLDGRIVVIVEIIDHRDRIPLRQ